MNRLSIEKLYTVLLCVLIFAGLVLCCVPAEAKADSPGVFMGSPARLSADGGLCIDARNFPDDNFRSYISRKLDPEAKGVLSAEAVSAVTEISCAALDISDLSGIEFFTSLRSLNCADNSLSDLKLDANTALVSLHCENNGLQSLELSKNTALTELYCYSNRISRLEVSGCAALERLSCGENLLSALDVSKNTALSYLSCGFNRLESLSLSNNTALEELYAPRNALSRLDLSSNRRLRVVNCHANSLTELNLHGRALEELYCSSNSLTVLDLADCPKLKRLSCQENRLFALELGGCPALSALICYDQRPSAAAEWTGEECSVRLSPYLKAGSALILSADAPAIFDGESGALILTAPVDSLISYSLAPSPNMPEKLMDVHLSVRVPDEQHHDAVSGTFNGSPAWLSEKGELLISAENFPDAAFRAHLASLCGASISAEAASALSELDCTGLGIEDLKGIGYFTSLETLRCAANRLESLELSALTRLSRLCCEENELSSLDLSANTALTELACDANRLKTLDLGANTELRILSCASNSLAAIDVSRCLSLEELNCDSNALTSLELSRNSALTVLNCSSNGLTTLDLSCCNQIVTALCYSNRLTTVNLSGCTALDYLNCAFNSITTLDLSDCTELRALYCASNCLSSLELGSNPRLVVLSCALQSSTATAAWTGEGYSLDLAPIVGGESLGRVTLGSGGSYDSATGLVSLESSAKAGEEAVVSYSYDTGAALAGNALDVSLAVTLPDPAAPVITAHPRSASVLVGTTLTLSVEAQGEGLSYQWQVKAPDSVWEDSIISSANTPGITLTAYSLHNGFLYRCLVSNENGSVYSNSATLLVTAPKLNITRQPQSATVYSGDTLTLSVAAEGEELTYQWQVRAADSEIWYNSGIASAKSPILSFSPNMGHNGYSYRCAITGNGNIVLSEPATLTVLTHFTVTQQPRSLQVTVNSPVTLGVGVVGENVSYRWQIKKPGGLWENYDNATAATPSITLTATAELNSTQFRCIISDPTDSVFSDTVTLTVTSQ